ncbi:MAG: ABC transporter ATP-binding protein [Acidobacteriota bacterium]
MQSEVQASRLMPTLDFVNFCRERAGRAVVWNLSLSLRGGQIWLLAGPDGAGKSSLVQAVVGLGKPSRGDVFINGVSISHEEVLAQRRRIGYLHHPPILYEQLTAREFLSFIGNLYGLKEELPGRIAEFLERFSLNRLADRLICRLPPAARSRLALVAALFHHPDILILDEPDFLHQPEEAAAVRTLLAGFKEKGGLGLITCPTLRVAERLADRLAILHEGQLRFQGTPLELRQQFKAEPDVPLQTLFERLIRPGLIPP